MITLVAILIFISTLSIMFFLRLKLLNPITIFLIFVMFFSIPRIIMLEAFDFNSEILHSYNMLDIKIGMSHYFVSTFVFLFTLIVFGAKFKSARAKTRPSYTKEKFAYLASRKNKMCFFLLFCASIFLTISLFLSGIEIAEDTEDFLAGTRNFGIISKTLSGLGLCYIIALALEAKATALQKLHFYGTLLAYILTLLLLYRASQIAWILIFIYIFSRTLSVDRKDAHSSYVNLSIKAKSIWRIYFWRLIAMSTTISAFLIYKVVRTGLSYGYIELGSLNARSLDLAQLTSALYYFVVYKGAEFSIFDSSIALLVQSSNSELREAIFNSTFGAFAALLPDLVIEYRYEPLGKLIKSMVVTTQASGGIPAFGYSTIWLSQSISLYCVVTAAIFLPLWHFYRQSEIGVRGAIFYPYFLLSFVNFLRIGDVSVAYTQTVFLLFLPSLVLYLTLKRHRLTI